MVKANPSKPESFPFFVFGNKLDKADERKVKVYSKEIKVPIVKVEEWLKKNNNLPYEEVSAIEGANVEVAFNRIAQQLLRKQLS